MRISDWSSDVCSSDLEIQHRRTRAQAILDHADAHLEIRTRAIELVDEAHARDVIFFGLAPHRLGLRLDPGDAIEARDRSDERPVGKECVKTGRSRGSPDT